MFILPFIGSTEPALRWEMEMQTQHDFSRIATDELKRKLKFHQNDNGTMTMREECRRMWFVQEIGEELTRRGIDPWKH